MNTINGISYYDSLNKLTIGWLILLPFLLDPEPALKNPVAYVIAFLVGTLYQCGIQKCTKRLRNNWNMIKTQTQRKNLNGIEDYYRAYYKLAEKGMLMNIPILEAVENFLRNIFFIIMMYIIACARGCPQMEFITKVFGNSCQCAVGLAIIEILLLPTWWIIQNKIYELVWEGEHYLFENQTDNKK